MTYFRACPNHLYSLRSKICPNGAEMILCPDGHTCLKWLIMDLTGKVVGIGYKDKPGILLAGMLEWAPTLPHDADERMCRRGHSGPWVKRRDGRKRCGQCIEDRRREKHPRRQMDFAFA